MKEVQTFEESKKTVMEKLGLNENDYPVKAADAHCHIIKILAKNEFSLYECKKILEQVWDELMQQCRLSEAESCDRTEPERASAEQGDEE